MNQQQLRDHALSQLPKYLVNRYTLGKTIRRNNLRQNQLVLCITRDAKRLFLLACEILGFASFYDVDGDVFLSENKFFYPAQGNPVFQEDDADHPAPVFFFRCEKTPAEMGNLEESVRMYEEEMSPVGLSDDGFAAHEYCAPILIAKSLRRIRKKYILLQRHPELDNWMSPTFQPLSWFELVPT